MKNLIVATTTQKNNQTINTYGDEKAKDFFKFT